MRSSARESKTAAVRGTQAVHAELTAKAIGTRLHPPQSAQLSGVRQPMLLNAAYLLDTEGSVAFTAAVAGALLTSVSALANPPADQEGPERG